MQDQVLVAVPAGVALEPIARAARSLAALFDLPVRGIHVAEPGSPAVAELSARAGFPVELVDGDPLEVLRAAFGREPVVVGVVGAADVPAEPCVLGHVAVELARSVDRPLLVVPPAATLDGRPIHRVLVPLEGDAPTSAQLTGLLQLWARPGLELVDVHVFDRSHVPGFLDATGHAIEAWRHEFRARHRLPEERPLKLRRGPADAAIADVADEVDADVIVLVWSQQLVPGHAAVVRRCLLDPRRPTLLVPAVADTPPPSGRTGVGVPPTRVRG